MVKIDNRSSTAVRCLERAWKELRRVEPRVPRVVLSVLTSGEQDRRLGYFAPHRWAASGGGTHDVAVHPGLFGNKTELLGTLVHEAAHALLADDRGGCSGAKSQYHRKQFRDVARELGLSCEFVDTRHGWASTGWPDDQVDDRYQSVLRVLDGLPAGTKRQPRSRAAPKATSTPKSGLQPMACACQPPRRIYAAKAIRTSGGVTCERCEQEFVEA